MKKSFIVLSALLSALVAPFLAGSASAATITYVSVVGNWHDPTDNVPEVSPVIPSSQTAHQPRLSVGHNDRYAAKRL